MVDFLKVQRYFEDVSRQSGCVGEVSRHFKMTLILRCENVDDLMRDEIHMMNVVLDVHDSLTLNVNVGRCSLDCRFCAEGELVRPLV